MTEWSKAAWSKACLSLYDTPDKWRDDGLGGTTVVDPVRNSLWIHEGQNDWHARSVQRGRAYNSDAVKHILAMQEQPLHAGLELFNPTPAQVGGRFESHIEGGCGGWRGLRRKKSGVGNFPIIDEKLRRDELQDKARDQIEYEMREADHLREARIFDRTGKPDYGRLC